MVLGMISEKTRMRIVVMAETKDLDSVLKNLSQKRKKSNFVKKDETPMIVKLHQMDKKNNKSKGRKKK